MVDGLTYIPAGFLKNDVDFSPQVEIFAYNKYKCFGDPETLVESSITAEILNSSFIFKARLQPT